MNELVASNSLLSILADWLQGILNTGHFFHLYKNNLIPTPANILSDFVECDFDGYTPYNLTGQFSYPIKQIDGEYLIGFTTSLFGCESGSQIAYGGYISDGVSVKLSQAFATPLTVNAGDTFVVPVIVLDLSLSIEA